MAILVQVAPEAPIEGNPWWQALQSALDEGLVPLPAASVASGECRTALLSIWDWWDFWGVARQLPGWQAIEGEQIRADWVPVEPISTRR